VAGIFDELGISEVIDKAMPKTRECKLKHSAIMKGLVLNGLGFVECRLYIFPTYFKYLATESSLVLIRQENACADHPKSEVEHGFHR